MYFRPVLTRQSSYLAHPAFSSLSVMTFSTPNGVVFRKLDEPDRVLAVKWNAKGPVGHQSLPRGQRCGVGRRPPGGTVLDPCLMLRIPTEGARWSFSLP